MISYLQNETSWPQSFNPAFVASSPGTGGKRGLLVRSQNCTGWLPGQCIGCNVDATHPIAPWFPGSVITFAEQLADGTFAQPYLVFAPEAGQPEDYGTEDPRLTYDPASALYHLFYTCYSSTIGPRLCHATTADPTAPYPGSWTRYGQVFPEFGAGTKSAALVLRESPPHYLFWGAGEIALAVSDDLVNFTTVNPGFIQARAGNFDSWIVEAGPSPMASSFCVSAYLLPAHEQVLSDGNLLFFYNSANDTQHCYNPAFVIVSGSDPTIILQRAYAPMLSPVFDWQLGDAPAECNVACVVFLEAAAPVEGEVDTFDVWFGGSDAVVGTARVHVDIAGSRAGTVEHTN